MGLSNVTAEIAKLDAISRTRALDDRESSRLQKLITVEHRYIGNRASNRLGIEERLRITLAGMRREFLEPRAIYLNPADRAEADRAGIVATDEAAEVAFESIPVRATTAAQQRSLVYSTHGVARMVRVRR